MQVMVVDDNLSLRRALARVVRRIGLTVAAQASSGQEALAALALHSIDLIITDCQMPVMDGLTFTRRLRSSGSQIPVVMLSGQTEPLVHRAAARAGVNAFLLKPVVPDRLLDTIQQLFPDWAVCNDAAASSVA
jgi:CheY-like chemotaxis protein